jgi:hypothetical protein
MYTAVADSFRLLTRAVSHAQATHVHRVLKGAKPSELPLATKSRTSRHLGFRPIFAFSAAANMSTIYLRRAWSFCAFCMPPMETEMALKKTILEPSWEAKYSFSPAVITEGGKTIWLAGHVGFIDDTLLVY